MCLTIGVTILASTTEIKIVLYYQFNVCTPVWSSKASMYLHIHLFLLTALHMNLIYISEEPEDKSGLVYTFQKTETPRRVWIIPETDHLLFRILLLSTS